MFNQKNNGPPHLKRCGLKQALVFRLFKRPHLKRCGFTFENKKRFSKRGIALPFNWIFAIIVGTVILFLALYAVSQFVSTSQNIGSTETSAKLVGIFEGVGGIGDEKIEIEFREESRVEFSCDELSNRPFGLQRVRYGEGLDISIKDKYIFSEGVVEGKKLNVFSKPFYLGYKVSDLVIVSNDNYCFVDAPLEIKEELSSLGLSNVKFDDSECEGIDVCFSGGCDIVVDNNVIRKDGKRMIYVDNLIFAGIFSSPEIYECNVKRLVSRFKELALIYEEKVSLIEDRGCKSNLDVKLSIIRDFDVESSADLILFNDMVGEVNEINKIQPEGCEVW